jgi:hypothetical protein
MSDFEGFDGQTKEQPSKSQFWTRKGVNEMAAGDAPPADNTTFRVNKRKGENTPASFVKKIGG